MEMSDDSMTSLDPHQLHHAAAAGAAGPHDWAGPAGGQLVQTTANISPVVAGAGAELRSANGGVFSHNQQQQQDNGECGAGPAQWRLVTVHEFKSPKVISYYYVDCRCLCCR